MKKVLVVAAHPDDEVLGCGGTLAKLAEKNTEVRVMFMTNGVSARSDTNISLIEKRKQAAIIALKQLNIKNIYWNDFPDNKMDTIALLTITQAIKSIITSFKPDTIFTHHGGDLNIDHRATHQALLTACRPQPGFPVQRILCFEVPSSTEWASSTMTVFKPIYREKLTTGQVETKLKALAYYEDEMRSPPHPRSLKSIEALLSWRGSEGGVEFAEAFTIERWIN